MNRRQIGALLAFFCISFVATQAIAQAKKLDYRQRESLKDAKYFVEQAEGLINAIDERAAPMKVGDASVSINDVRTLMNTRDKVNQYLKNVIDRLANLPADHPDVKPMVESHAELTKRMQTLSTKIDALNAGLEKVVNQGGTQEYKVDFDRLQEINQLFANPQVLNTQPAVAVETIKLMKPIQDERRRIAEKYAALLKQPTAEADRMKGVLRHFDSVYPQFDNAVQQYVESAKSDIPAQMDRAVEMAKNAVANKTPAWFGPDGGIAQQLNEARTRLAIVAAYLPDSAEANAAAAAITRGRAAVDEQGNALMAEILESNRVPDDQYAGGDKDQLVDIVRKKWAEGGVAGEVRQVGINSRDWQRDTRWEWSSNAWYKIDKSRAQGFVVVKNSDDFAAVYHINLVKDHLGGDKIDAYFFDDPKEPPAMNRKVLTKNLR